MAELIAHRSIVTTDSVRSLVRNCGKTNCTTDAGTTNYGYSNESIKDCTGKEQSNGQITKSNGNAIVRIKRARSTSTGSKSSLVFRDVSVVINKKQILHRISGVAKVGDTLAIMGPSGAGKSTLLNVLGGRVPPTSGLVTFDGEPVTRKLRRKISYVLQADVFYPNLTLRETLTFALLLRLADKMPHKLKLRRMQDIVEALELGKCMDTIMGDAFITGLSGGERKRASIACELLTNPRIIILDEPTSGLDSAIAYSLMDTLSKYSLQSHKTVVTTIHQPSSQVFYMFSNVLLITDGHVAYYGAGKKVLEYFAGLGLHCQPHYNPADFILEQVKSTTDVVKRILDGAKALRSTSEWPEELKSGSDINNNEIVLPMEGYTEIMEDINQEKSMHRNGFTGETSLDDVRERHPTVSVSETTYDSSYLVEGEKWPTGFWSQYCTLTKRSLLRSKTRYLSKYRIGQMLFIALCASLVWFQTERAEASARDRLGILFFVIVFNGFLPMMDGIFCLFDESGVFVRERASGIYRLSSYYLATTTSEIPSSLCFPTLFIAIVYWTTGLMPAAQNFFGFLLLVLLSVFTAQSVGIFMGVLIRDKLLSTIVGQCFMISSMLAAGFYNTNLPSWISWVRYLSYITYALNGLAKLEFQYGSDLTCRDASTTIFPDYCSVPGLSRQTSPTVTINSSSIEARLKSLTASQPTKAPPITGEIPGVEFLKDWDMNFTPLYVDIIILCGMMLAVRVAAYIVLRLRRPGGRKSKPCACCRSGGGDQVVTGDDYDE